MNFANPQAWHLLWLIPFIAAGLHLFYKYRYRMMSRFVGQHLIDELAQGFSLKQYRWKAVFLLIAFIFMVVALSRPQWGYHMRPVKHHGLDIMVAIDVSKSMLTQDVKPSRLERTKLAVKDLVIKLNGADHIGLIAFAGDAMVMCPFTYDYNGFLLSLDDLSVNSIPRGGTDIAAAIDEGIKAYKGMLDSDKALVLITDGEEEEGNALDAARRAGQNGIKIFTVGVGTQEGGLIQVTSADGQTEFLKDADGNVVKSHLNENLLQQIAYITGGAYIRSGGTQFGLDYLYDRQLSKLKKHDAQQKMAKLYDERFQWPLTLAIVFLLAEMWISVPQRKAYSFLIITFFLFIPTKGFASIAGEVNKANDLYTQGKFNDALDLYQEALDEDNQSPVVKYDLGTDLYKKGDYTKALGYLEQAAADKNIKIKPKAEYNLGNVLYKSGVQKENTNVDEAITALQEALGHYGQTIVQDPKDQDALFNEGIVKKEIKRLKQIKRQQKQQNQQQQQNQNQQQKSQQNQQNQQNQQGQQNQQNQKKQQGQQNRQQQHNQQGEERQQGQRNKQGQKNQQNAERPQESQKDLDRQQAEDILEEYQENEEPKKLLSYMPQKIDDRPVLKDW